MYRPINPILEVNGHAIPPGFYSSFEIADDAESKRAFIESFSTPEQRAYNASKRTCGDCRGLGYYVYRNRGQLVRENVGCDTCGGTGALTLSGERQSAAAEGSDGKEVWNEYRY